MALYRTIILLLNIVLISGFISAQDVIMPAEFEKNQGILLKWNYNPSVDSSVSRIAAIASADDKVWILYDPANSTPLSAIQTTLVTKGVNLTNVVFLEGTAENPWLRDYGPFTGYYLEPNSEKRHFIDAQYNSGQSPVADNLPFQLATQLNFNYEALALSIDGGNLLIDGIGRAFVGDQVLAQNPGKTKNQIIQSLYTTLSLNEIIILPSIPQCGGGAASEISRLVKIIDSETVMVSQFPSNTPYYSQVELIADSLSKMYNDVGKPFQVIRLPVAANEDGNYPAGNDGILRTYTTALIFNNKIIIPFYNKPTDNIALNAYKQVFPGYKFYQVPSQVLASMHGSLFRLAVDIPQEKLCRIRHSKKVGMIEYENEVFINAFVQSFEPVDTLQLYYRIHPSAEYQVVDTYGCCGGNSAAISGFAITDTVSYYLRSKIGDLTNTLPVAAPETIFTFWFDPFTGIAAFKNSSKVTFYPNPAKDVAFIKGIDQFEAGVKYQLFNVAGVLVAEGPINNHAEIHFSNSITNGFYILKFTSHGETHISKLYLQR